MTRSDTLADDDVERALLGACLLSDIAIEAATPILTPADFNTTRHQQIYDAIIEQHRHGRVDTVTLATALPNLEPGYLHQLQNAAPSITNAARYATTIADFKLRRDLIHAADQITRLANGNTVTTDAGDAADKARALLADLDLPAGQGAPDPDIDTFIASVDTRYDWLIPNLLEYRDRLLVTAGEGAGKSVLLAQIAVMAAAGLHPWTHELVPARNVLVVDLENGERLVTRRYAGIVGKVNRSMFDPQRLRIHVRTDGLDLTTRQDRRWLLDRCRANATELLVIGPAYRMAAGVASKGDVGGEDQARTVTKALDEIRHRCNLALLIETHAPHGNNFGRDLRPFGSSVWLRWPEFGIGLRRDQDNTDRYAVEHWRGPRDQRTWPTALEKRAGKWPWTPILPNGNGGAP